MFPEMNTVQLVMLFLAVILFAALLTWELQYVWGKRKRAAENVARVSRRAELMNDDVPCKHVPGPPGPDNSQRYDQIERDRKRRRKG